MPRLSSPSSFRFLLLLVGGLLAGGGCAHQRIARESLERQGCEEIELTKASEGFELRARCGQQQCTGTLVVRGTRWKNEVDTNMSCSG